MKKRLITMITIMALVAAFIVPSYGDIWNPGGADIPGAAALYLAQENGSYAVGSQLNNSGELSGGYLYIKTDVHIDGENGVLHDGKETLEVVGINGSTLDNITSMEKKSGSDWIDVTDSVMNHENAFEQKDQFTNVFRFKLDGDVQFSLQYKVLTDDTPAQYYESPKRYVQVSDGAYYYTKYEENVTTEAPSEEPTEAPTEETTEAPTEEPTTEPEVNPNNYKYSFVSYYEEFPDSNDNGVNLVTQQGATVEGVTATASADDASYVIDADPNTIWNASGDDTQWITVDLGEVKTVKEIDCRWAEDNTAKAYTVMVSTYGNEFQPVATVDNDSFYDNRRDMIVLGESISTRYIKIEMTESHLTEGYSLREMAVYDDSNYVGIVDYLNKVNTTENLAYKKTPIVARYNNEGQARRFCDGNLNTGWRANKPTDNSWFAIDLKDYYNIEDVMVCWSDANAVDYDIYAGRIPDWYGDEPVASVRGLWDNKAVSAVTKDLNVKARYIKIEVEEWSENSERDGIQPLEIAVFGEKAEGYYNIRDYKWVWPWQYPTMEGKIFAGWFTDETLTESYMDEDGYAYPKFIDEKSLTVKMQKKEDGTAIRFVSTISRRLDDFESAGFDFSGTYGDSTIESKSKSIETVYRRITAAGETIRPNTAFDNNDSAYFVTYTIRNMDGVTPSNWTVTPFYVTADGTKVTGKTATFDVVPE